MANILVVEDNMANRDLIVYMLRAAGHDADIARDGVEGLDALRSHEYELALVDIFMPRMDGLQMVKTVREETPDIKMPFVAVTASAMRGERERLLESGFDGYISKPIDVLNFMDQIAPFLEAA